MKSYMDHLWLMRCCYVLFLHTCDPFLFLSSFCPLCVLFTLLEKELHNLTGQALFQQENHLTVPSKNQVTKT